jgi:hypothetical protein
MKVRPIEECAQRYLRNCLRAYLEGKKNLRWLAGIIGPERQNAASALRAFNDIRSPMDPQRRVEFMNWVMPRLEPTRT